jgi:hypothetical protein
VKVGDASKRTGDRAKRGMGESVTGASGCYGEAPELGLMFPGSPAVLDQILNQADALPSRCPALMHLKGIGDWSTV